MYTRRLPTKEFLVGSSGDVSLQPTQKTVSVTLVISAVFMIDTTLVSSEETCVDH